MHASVLSIHHCLASHPQGVSCDAPVEGTQVVHGAGVTAVVDGRRVAAGTAGLLASHAGVEGPEVQEALRVIDAEGWWKLPSRGMLQHPPACICPLPQSLYQPLLFVSMPSGRSEGV